MAEAHVERRLAAILAADIVGYSRLMGIDEEGTLAALKTHRRELIDPKISEHRGRIVKTTGDGALVEFASAVAAVRCALDIQRAMAERNADIPEDRRIEFRMGINVGDIIVDEGDVYGDGVNIAETLSAPMRVFRRCLLAATQGRSGYPKAPLARFPRPALRSLEVQGSRLLLVGVAELEDKRPGTPVAASRHSSARLSFTPQG
jgi:class 3 adenylate cyclase